MGKYPCGPGPKGRASTCRGYEAENRDRLKSKTDSLCVHVYAVCGIDEFIVSGYEFFATGFLRLVILGIVGKPEKPRPSRVILGGCKIKHVNILTHLPGNVSIAKRAVEAIDFAIGQEAIRVATPIMIAPGITRM